MYPNENYDNHLKNAGIAGVCAALLGIVILAAVSVAPRIVSSTSSGFLLGAFTLLQLLYIPSVALFTYGLAVLGKKYQSKYLEVLSYLSIVVGVLYGLIIILGLYDSSLDKNFWDVILNRGLSSIVGIGIAVALFQLFSRFGLLVGAYAAFSVILNFMGLLGAPANTFAILMQLGLYGVGVILLFRASRD